MRAPLNCPLHCSILLLAAAIFVIDAVRPFDIAAAELYVIVILLSVRVWARRGQLLVIGACVALTVLASLAFQPTAFSGPAAWHCLVSLGVLAIAGYIAMADRAAADVLSQRGESLGRSIAVMAAAQRLSQTGSASFDGDSGRLQWSAQAARIFGQPPSAEPSPAMLMERIPAADRDLLRHATEQMRADGDNIDVRHRVLMPDGTIKQVRLLVRAMVGADGGLEYLAAIMDGNAELAAERVPCGSAVDSAHANQVGIDVPIASFAHEVSQPLAAISMNGHACLRWIDRAEPNLAEARASLARILDACLRAGQMIGRFRAVAACADQAAPSHATTTDERAQLTVGPVS